MTLENFIDKYKKDCNYYFDGYYSPCVDDFLTKIYSEHTVEFNEVVKAKDEEIERLKDELRFCWNRESD